MDVNCHFLEHKYDELSFFSVVLNCKINGPIFSVQRETIVENVSLASNCDYNHGTNVRISME